MWIFLNDAMLSIVDATAWERNADAQRRGTIATRNKGPRAEHLLVRARKRVDIMRTFPKARVNHLPDEARDYPFRALVRRAEVVEAIARAVEGIDYGNFKATVTEPDRHSAYVGVWYAARRLEARRTGTHPQSESFADF